VKGVEKEECELVLWRFEDAPVRPLLRLGVSPDGTRHYEGVRLGWSAVVSDKWVAQKWAARWTTIVVMQSVSECSRCSKDFKHHLWTVMGPENIVVFKFQLGAESVLGIDVNEFPWCRVWAVGLFVREFAVYGNLQAWCGT